MTFSQHPAIPGYEPVRRLGQNGGIVYVAWSARVGRRVALKVWYPSSSSWARESVLVGLEHPNILGVLDAGEVDGHVYVALEYFEDVESLGVRLRRGPIAENEARGLTTVIASVLQFVREKGVAVAALTPGDVLLIEPPKLMLHPMTGHHSRFEFTAPEEWCGTQQATTATIDVYRVGALLYAMLTGRPPVSLASVPAAGWQAVPAPDRVRQVNPGIGDALETICMKCLEKAPLDRYSSLQELIEALNRSGRAFTDGLTGGRTHRRPRWVELFERLVGGGRRSAARR